MRRMWALFGAAAMCLLSGCSFQSTQALEQRDQEIRVGSDTTENSEETDAADLSRGDLYTMFEEINNETLVDFQYGDYNQDGVHEAFALTSGDGYRLWYMRAEGCEPVTDAITGSDVSLDRLSYSTKEYLLLQITDDGRRGTKVYSVDNRNQILEPVISDMGYLHQTDDGELILQVYDDEKGRSDYYLYYNPDDGFCEYGGIPIAVEQFLEFEGAQEILDRIDAAYEGQIVNLNFIYRSNHYIHINIEVQENGERRYDHTTLQYDAHAVELTGKLSVRGREETAHVLEIATFPTAFKHPDNTPDS